MDEYRGHAIYGNRESDPGDSVYDSRPVEPNSGGIFELVAAGFAVVAAVLALLQIATFELATVATIAAGLALLAQGATIATRWSHAQHIPATARTELAGISIELLGGLAAIVLGILAVADIAPEIVLPAAALVLGGALVFGGPAQPSLATRAARKWYVTRDTVRSSGGVMVMAGIAAIVLGTLALLVGPMLTFALVAVLCVALSLIVAGGMLTRRVPA